MIQKVCRHVHTLFFCKMCKITTSLLYLFCLLYARPNWLHRQKNYDKIKNAQPRADKTPFCAGKMEKAGKTMGISHDYHSAPRRARRGTVSGKLRFLGAVVAILLVSYAITAILEKGAEGRGRYPRPPTPAALPRTFWHRCPCRAKRTAAVLHRMAAPVGRPSHWRTLALQSRALGAYTVKAYDASVIRQPSCGQVDLSYFADAAFLGDSLTVGFSDYQINLDGALICGYTGVGPDAIVNRSAVKSPTRGQEVALDVLAAARPRSCISCWALTPSPRWALRIASLPTMARCWICCARLWARTA